MDTNHLILIRHGQSLWNQQNLFTGWTDVDLSMKGKQEARRAAELLKKTNWQIDITFTSYLKRAIRTLNIILDLNDIMYLPVIKSWKLNERHYGALQGMNKDQTKQKFGEKQVKIWRRSYDVKPPLLEICDERYPGHDKRYKSLKNDQLPLGESLKDTSKRVLKYWQNCILPHIQEGKKVMISAHGNSLRALVKHLDKISDDEIIDLNIPTGVPLIYEFKKKQNFEEKINIQRKYYLNSKQNSCV